jgi:hypothetical protein
MARWSLCPKHCRRVQLFKRNAFFMLLPMTMPKSLWDPGLLLHPYDDRGSMELLPCYTSLVWLQFVKGCDWWITSVHVLSRNWDMIRHWSDREDTVRCCIYETLQHYNRTSILVIQAFSISSQNKLKYIEKTIYRPALGWSQGSMQASQVLPHWSRQTIPVWKSLCSQGHCHAETGKKLPQTVAIKDRII